MKPKIQIYDWYSVELCRFNPKTVFIFGDNMLAKGTKGQAIIRNERNACGFITKRLPDVTDDSYFEDGAGLESLIVHAISLTFIDFKLGKYEFIGFPKDGLGTGLAQMPTRCPVLFQFLCAQLELCFGFINPNPLIQ